MEAVLEARRPREYETILILDPKVSKEQAERVTTRISDVMAGSGGRLVKVDYWGKRKLAYKVRRSDWGFYYHVRFLGVGGIVAELERNFRMLDSVLKWQTIVLKHEVDAASYQPAAGDLEFHVDLLAKEASEPVRDRGSEQPAEAAAAAAERPASAPARDVGADDTDLALPDSADARAPGAAGEAAADGLPAEAEEPKGGQS